MKAWILIAIFYITTSCELFLDDQAIAVRYLHFAYLPYFALSLLFFIYLLFFHRQKILWFLPALFFISYTFFIPLFGYLPSSTTITTASPISQLKLLSFSINSRNHDYQKVAQLIKQNPADIICLQEIPYKRYPLFINALKQQQLNYQHSYSKRSTSMILAKQKIIPNATVPYQKATLTLKGQTLRIWNIHSPKSLKRKHYQGKFMSRLAKDVSSDKTSHKLICGDFNATPHNTFIRPFFKTMQPTFYASHSLFNFTYPTDRIKIPLPLPVLKIDYLFLSNTMKATQYKRLTNHANSDHYPITAHVNLYTTQTPSFITNKK